MSGVANLLLNVLTYPLCGKSAGQEKGSVTLMENGKLTWSKLRLRETIPALLWTVLLVLLILSGARNDLRADGNNANKILQAISGHGPESFVSDVTCVGVADEVPADRAAINADGSVYLPKAALQDDDEKNAFRDRCDEADKLAIEFLRDADFNLSVAVSPCELKSGVTDDAEGSKAAACAALAGQCNHADCSVNNAAAAVTVRLAGKCAGDDVADVCPDGAGPLRLWWSALGVAVMQIITLATIGLLQGFENCADKESRLRWLARAPRGLASLWFELISIAQVLLLLYALFLTESSDFVLGANDVVETLNANGTANDLSDADKVRRSADQHVIILASLSILQLIFFLLRDLRKGLKRSDDADKLGLFNEDDERDDNSAPSGNAKSVNGMTQRAVHNYY